MAQTLTVFSWNSFVNPAQLATQKNIYLNNVAALQNLNPRQLLGVSILGLCYVMDFNFGPFFVKNLPLLVTYATNFFGVTPVMDFPLGNRQQLVDLAAIDWSAASKYTSANSGGNITSPIPTDVATLLAAIQFLQDTPENTLWRYRKFQTLALAGLGV